MGSPEVDQDEALAGVTVADKYRVDRLIGRGGMGAVYEATNIAIGKRVALKFLDRGAARDRDSIARFQREAEAAGAVESAHIVHIFDSGSTDDGRPFLVMELLSGEDLRALLKREGRIALADAIHITGQVLRALARAHAAGIVHRDLKPDNVFLCRRDDDPMFVKIVDFGISKITRREATADTLTRRGVVLGTAFYMSPEQAQAFRDIDGRSDLFSVGAILFEALAGRPPHIGSVYEAVLIDICTKDAPNIRSLVPEIPEAVADVIARSLMRERDARWQDANDFYDALGMAAPGLLRTGGLGLPRAQFASTSDTNPIGKASTPGDPAAAKVVTAGGTAVPLGEGADLVLASGASNPRTHGRRIWVAGLVGALAAFAGTAAIMTGPGAHREQPPEPDPTTRALPAASVVTPPTPALVVAPVADAAASSAPSPALPDAGQNAVKPGWPPKPGLKPGASSQPSASTPPTRPHPPGVATGLTLDTHGP